MREVKAKSKSRHSHVHSKHEEINCESQAKTSLGLINTSKSIHANMGMRAEDISVALLGAIEPRRQPANTMQKD
jgi:hypothetical protein